MLRGEDRKIIKEIGNKTKIFVGINFVTVRIFKRYYNDQKYNLCCWKFKYFHKNDFIIIIII